MYTRAYMDTTLNKVNKHDILICPAGDILVIDIIPLIFMHKFSNLGHYQIQATDAMISCNA